MSAKPNTLAEYVEALEAAQARVAELERKHETERHYAQNAVDKICHYRNLAIVLGAKPEHMLGEFDRDLCIKGIDKDDTSNGYHMSVQEELDDVAQTWGLAESLKSERDTARAELEAVTRERDAKEREIERLLNVVCDGPACTAAIIRRDDGSRVCARGHGARWVNVDRLAAVELELAQVTRERDEARAKFDAVLAAGVEQEERIEKLEEQLAESQAGAAKQREALDELADIVQGVLDDNTRRWPDHIDSFTLQPARAALATDAGKVELERVRGLEARLLAYNAEVGMEWWKRAAIERAEKAEAQVTELKTSIEAHRSKMARLDTDRGDALVARDYSRALLLEVRPKVESIRATCRTVMRGEAVIASIALSGAIDEADEVLAKLDAEAARK